MSDDVLKRPVHLAILKPSHIQRLAEEGKIKATRFGLDPNIKPPALPAPVPQKKNVLNLPKFNKQVVESSSLVKLSQKQIKLQIMHERVKAPTPTPPCDTCKTAACCRAFVVNITEDEYESGLYGESAIKLTKEIYQQLRSRYLQVTMVGAPIYPGAQAAYYLDGKIGEACPFLGADNRCGIYDIRPITCRSYSCLGDARITEGMRQGTEAIDITTLGKRRLNVI